MRMIVGGLVGWLLAAVAAADEPSRQPVSSPSQPVAVVADSGPPADRASVRILKIAGAEPCVEPRGGADGDKPGMGRLRVVTREEALAIVDRLERRGRIVQDSRFPLHADAAAAATTQAVERSPDGSWQHTLDLCAQLTSRQPSSTPAAASVSSPCLANPRPPLPMGAIHRTAAVKVRSATQNGKQVRHVAEISTSVDLTSTNAFLFETAPVTMPVDRPAESQPYLWLVVITGNRQELSTARQPGSNPTE